MRTQDEEADHFTVVVLEDVADGEEVAERLRHLLVVDLHEAVVQPITHEAGGAVGEQRAVALGDLVLVMRELQIGAAAVDVELPPEQVGRHRRALDMPARATAAERRRPAHLLRLFRLGRLPQHEVEGIQFAAGHRHPLAGTQVVERLAAEAPVAGELAHGEDHVAVFGRVGVAVVLQALDHSQHLRHILGGARFGVGTCNAERRLVLMHRLDETAGQRRDRLAVLHGSTDDLVLDVGDVANVGHAIAAGPQPALDRIEGDEHAGVAHMAIVVDRHAADVHANLPGLQRDEGFLAAGQRVVELQHAEIGSGVGGDDRDGGARVRRWRR
jgi:hypothetical protein